MNSDTLFEIIYSAKCTCGNTLNVEEVIHKPWEEIRLIVEPCSQHTELLEENEELQESIGILEMQLENEECSLEDCNDALEDSLQRIEELEGEAQANEERIEFILREKQEEIDYIQERIEDLQRINSSQRSSMRPTVQERMDIYKQLEKQSKEEGDD